MQENVREEKVPTLIRHFLLFALIYYAYLYLFPFEQGVSAAPAPIKAIKDFVYIGVALTLLTMLPWHRITAAKAALIFTPFAMALFVTSALHSWHTGPAPQLLQNVKNIALYIPVYSVPFLVRRGTLDLIIRDLFILLPAMALLQCLFALAYHSSGHTLWDYGQYAGLIGNPNSFALFLNIGIACMLAMLPTRSTGRLIVLLALIGIFTWAILRTTSGSQLAILVFLLAFSFAFRLQYWKRYAAAIAVCASVMAGSTAKLDQAMFSMKGAETIVVAAKDPRPATPGPRPVTTTQQVPVLEKEGEEYVSRSVTLRRENLASTLAVFSKGADDILFGDFDTPTYKPMDGQYFVFMFNGGLLTLLTFLSAAGFVYLYSLRGAWRSQDNYLFGLNLIIAAFGITFLASRTLMYFPFNFMFFLVSGLAVAYASKVRT